MEALRAAIVVVLDCKGGEKEKAQKELAKLFGPGYFSGAVVDWEYLRDWSLVMIPDSYEPGDGFELGCGFGEPGIRRERESGSYTGIPEALTFVEYLRAKLGGRKLEYLIAAADAQVASIRKAVTYDLRTESRARRAAEELLDNWVALAAELREARNTGVSL